MRGIRNAIMRACITITAALAAGSAGFASDTAREVLSPLTVAAQARSGVGTPLEMATDAFEQLRPASMRLVEFPLNADRAVTLDLRSFQ